jgi:hypothetical protein
MGTGPTFSKLIPDDRVKKVGSYSDAKHISVKITLADDFTGGVENLNDSHSIPSPFRST